VATVAAGVHSVASEEEAEEKAATEQSESEPEKQQKCIEIRANGQGGGAQ
jgi:hypothetical protein